MERVDFGKTAQDYATHRAGFPAEFFERLAASGIGLPGQTVVDLGTGTGALALEFARRGCAVTGVDVAAPMVEAAAQRARGEGLAFEGCVAPAEDTGLPAGCADVVSAGQCWHWFDGLRAAAEVRRLLKPGGKVVVAHLDWIPAPGNLVALTEALIERFNPAWNLGGGNGRYPQWLPHLEQAGFTNLQTFSFDVDIPYTHEAWRGRIRASAGVGATLPRDAVAAFDAAHRDALRDQFPADPLAVPHRVWAVIGRVKGAATPGAK